MTATSIDRTDLNNCKKRPLEDLVEENVAQRRKTSPKSSSPTADDQISRVKSLQPDAPSFQELAGFAKGDTQPLAKSQVKLPTNEEGTSDTWGDSYEDILVTDPISSPNGFNLGFGQGVNFPITPGLSRRSLVAGNVSSNGKSSVVKTPGSAIRGMFGGADSLAGGAISLTQAFQQTPTQRVQFVDTHGPRSDPIFERPSPNWVSIESPAEYVKKPVDDVFRPPEKPASAARQHDPIVDSDDVFQEGDALPTPTQPEVQTIRGDRIKPRIFVGDSEDTHSEITLGHNSPFLGRKDLSALPLQTPEAKLVQLNGLNRSSKANGGTAEHFLKKEVVIAATPNSDKITDSQSHSQPLPRADLPSSPPMIQQSQEPSLDFMNRIKDLDNEAQAALDTSLPFPPHSSDMANRSSQSQAEDGTKVTCTGKSENPRQSEQDLAIEDGPGESVSQQDRVNTIDLNSHDSILYRKLGEIAAEPSQSVSGSLQLDLFDHDDEFEKVIEPSAFNLSGSSPVDTKRRRNKPNVLQASPLKSQVSQGPSQGSVSASQNLSTSNKCHSQSVVSDIDLLQFIPESTTEKEKQLGSTNRITRPLKFLQDEETRNKKRQQALQKKKIGGGSIWEFEETQLVTQSEQASNEEAVYSQKDDRHVEDCAEAVTDTVGLSIRYPNRVLAYCKNPYNACYPATFVSANHQTDGKYACDVVFDDGTTISVPAGQAEKWIFRLELKVGDLVKIEGHKNKMFVVTGLTSILDTTSHVGPGVNTGQNENPVDIFGHQKVLLQPKTRDSDVSTKVLDSSNIILQSISNIIIAPKEFHSFASRIFVPPEDSPSAFDKSTHVPNSSRPVSGSRRITTTFDHPNPLTPTLEMKSTDSNLFARMSFAVSIENEEMKRKITNHIECNGGIMLDSGFEEVFDLSNTILSEQSKPNSFKSSTKTMQYSTSLHLSTTFSDFGFTAVIADSYSRKEKHMQALALGLPVLHYQWVHDCMSASKVISWGNYLLPAGQSSYLHGAIKSRLLEIYNPLGPEANLTTVIERRALLLQDQKILVIPGRGQTLSKRQRAFIFLMMALGASSLMQVSDLDTAKDVLNKQGWDYIYHDLEGGKYKKVSKSEAGTDMITDEFVAQSLIFGELVS